MQDLGFWKETVQSAARNFMPFEKTAPGPSVWQQSIVGYYVKNRPVLQALNNNDDNRHSYFLVYLFPIK